MSLLSRFRAWCVRVHEKPRFVPMPFGLGRRQPEPRGDFYYTVTADRRLRKHPM